MFDGEKLRERVNLVCVLWAGLTLVSRVSGITAARRAAFCRLGVGHALRAVASTRCVGIRASRALCATGAARGHGV